MAKYFKQSEFECKCGCGLYNLSEELLAKLDIIREKVGKPLIINSACRCEEHNRKIGGKTDSAHLKGYAVDISAKNGRDKFLIIENAIRLGISRIGVYKDFIHLDIDPSKDDSVVW